MTAIEWLVENLISEPYSEAEFEHNKECWDKAEEMEKQQIIDAYHINPLESKWKNIGIDYYNETFKSK